MKPAVDAFVSIDVKRLGCYFTVLLLAYFDVLIVVFNF